MDEQRPLGLGGAPEDFAGGKGHGVDATVGRGEETGLVFGIGKAAGQGNAGNDGADGERVHPDNLPGAEQGASEVSADLTTK